MFFNAMSAKAETEHISIGTAAPWANTSALKQFQAIKPVQQAQQQLARLGPQPQAAQHSPSQMLMAQVLDALSLGMWLLAADGRVVFANRYAQQVSQAQNVGLGVVAGKLHMGQAAEQGKLLAAIKGAAQGKWGMVSVAHQSGGATSVGTGGTWPLSIVPLDERGSGQAVVALAVLASTAQSSELALGLFCREHGITPAERHVLAELSAGQEPEQVAKSCGVALTTVRTQIGSIRTKTRSKSLKHLLCTVAALPPVAARAVI